MITDLQTTHTPAKNYAITDGLNCAIVHRRAGDLWGALHIHQNSQTAVLACADSLLKAKHYNGLGITYQLLSEKQENKEYAYQAIFAYNLVKYHLNEIDDLPAIAVVEANIANVLLMLHQTTEAHSHLNISEQILKEFAEDVLLAQALETRARVFLAEGDSERALEAIERSEALLCGSKEAYPVECEETQRTKVLVEAARK